MRRYECESSRTRKACRNDEYGPHLAITVRTLYIVRARHEHGYENHHEYHEHNYAKAPLFR